MRAKRVVLIGTRSADFIMARGHRAAPFEADGVNALADSLIFKTQRSQYLSAMPRHGFL